MKRFGLVAGLVLLAAACGGPHMDDAYGKRVRGAFDAQIAKTGGSGAIIMGDDAKTILMRHRGLEQSSTLYKSSGYSGSSASSGGGSGSSSMNMPSVAPPRLDAMK